MASRGQNDPSEQQSSGLGYHYHQPHNTKPQWLIMAIYGLRMITVLTGRNELQEQLVGSQYQYHQPDSIKPRCHMAAIFGPPPISDSHGLR